jgi:hypothetical protein
MALIQVGLVDTTGRLDQGSLHAAAAAINVQVMRDLTQFWDITATVQYLPDPSRIPAGVWPVLLVGQLPPGEGGFHLDKHNQPYAKVIATPAADDWTVDASHEILEMLVDPFGNRLQSSRSIEIVGGKIQDGAGEFSYLVEACDPCEANDFAYTISGVLVSDFLTPHFYDPVVSGGKTYSFRGNITAPRQILPGGYISWLNPETNEMQQILFVDPDSPPHLVDLGPAQGASLREWVDSQTHQVVKKHRKSNKNLIKKAKEHRSHLEAIAVKRGKLYEVKRGS